MHHGPHHHHRRGRLFFRGPFPNRQELLDRLERYQRDLEQELADVADVIAHLRDRPGEATAEAQA
jgi:hypothetical protein